RGHGAPPLHATASGRPVLLTGNGGKTLFLTGLGASPEGQRPFLDALDLGAGGDGKAPRHPQRLFHSAAPYFEMPADLLDEAGKTLLLRRESPTEPPNYFAPARGTGPTPPARGFPD